MFLCLLLNKGDKMNYSAFFEANQILYYYFLPFLIILPLFLLFYRFNLPENDIIKKEPPLKQKKNILVVDDSKVVLKKLNNLLENDFFIISALHGEEALEALEKYHIDLVITDLEMPVMDGFELISHIVSSMQTEHIPIIAITSHEDLTAKVHLMKGVYGIFNKPWNDRELLSRINNLLKINS